MMTPLDILVPAVLLLAFVGYVWCLSRNPWVTFALTGGLAFFMAQRFALDVITPLQWGQVSAFVLGAIVAVRVLPKPSASVRAPKKPRSEQAKEVVIDGTNVMYWNGDADLDTLRAVVQFFQAREIAPIVFLDASSRHHLGDKSLTEKGFAKALGLPTKRVMVCPAQTEADVFILKFAKDQKLPIVSNDRFGDRAQQAKGIKLIKGVFARGKPIFDGL